MWKVDGTAQGEKYYWSTNSLVDLDAKFLDKMLTNRIQQYMQGSYTVSKGDLPQECKGGLTPENQQL